MPLTEEEVLIKLKLQADASGLNKTLSAFGKQVTAIGDKIVATMASAISRATGSKTLGNALTNTYSFFKRPGVQQTISGAVGGYQASKAGGGNFAGNVAGAATGGLQAAAGAAGGPAAAAGVGAAIGIGKAIGKTMVTGLSAPAKLIGMVMTTLTGGLRELQGPLGPIGLGFNAVAKGGQLAAKTLGMVSPLFGKALGKSIDFVIGPAKELTTVLTQMAAVASPGTFKIWTMALEDVQGVIGQAVTPILQTMTEGVRLFGDVLATVLPDMSEMNAVLDEMRPDWEGLKNEIRAFASEFGPTIRNGIITIFRELAAGAGLAARGITWLTQQLGVLFRNLGFSAPPGGQGMRSSQGAAARQASITGLEDYQRQLLTSAFSQPAGASDSPQVQTVNWLERIHGVMERVRIEIEKVVQGVQNFGNGVNREIGTRASAAINQIQQGTGIDIGRTIQNAAANPIVGFLRAGWGW